MGWSVRRRAAGAVRLGGARAQSTIEAGAACGWSHRKKAVSPFRRRSAWCWWQDVLNEGSWFLSEFELDLRAVGACSGDEPRGNPGEPVLAQRSGGVAVYVSRRGAQE